MKEFGFNIDKHFSKGLRKSYKENKNGEHLTEIQNLSVGQYGVSPYNAPEMAWTEDQLAQLGITIHFPFPQLIKMTKYTVLMGIDYMFMVLNDNTLVQVDTYDFHHISNEKAIIAGNRWQVIDFFETFVLTNGMCSLWYDRVTAKVLVEDTVLFSACCDYKGRGVFAGFDSEKSWGSAWQTYWSTNADSAIGDVMPLDKNWIAWSSVGEGLTDLINAGKSEIDLLKNDSGNMPLRMRERILTLKELSGKLIAYSLDSISIVSHKSSPTSTITPDIENIAPGIANSGAIDGDKQNHVFVDMAGNLWWIGSNLRPAFLGYKEYFSPLLGSDLIVSYDSINGDFYIGNEDVTYLLSWNSYEDRPQGLSEVKQVIMSLVEMGGVVVNTGTDVQDLEARVMTSILDLGRTGLKSLRWITFHGEEGILDTTGGTVYIRVHYRYSINKTFSQTKWKKVSKEGAVYFPISGVDFKIELKCDEYDLLNLSRLYITFQNDDNRFTRGIDVSKTNY